MNQAQFEVLHSHNKYLCDKRNELISNFKSFCNSTTSATEEFNKRPLIIAEEIPRDPNVSDDPKEEQMNILKRKQNIKNAVKFSIADNTYILEMELKLHIDAIYMKTYRVEKNLENYPNDKLKDLEYDILYLTNTFQFTKPDKISLHKEDKQLSIDINKEISTNKFKETYLDVIISTIRKQEQELLHSNEKMEMETV